MGFAIQIEMQSFLAIGPKDRDGHYSVTVVFCDMNISLTLVGLETVFLVCLLYLGHEVFLVENMLTV